jgi:dCTP deaminase
MILSDQDLYKAIDNNWLHIDPFHHRMMQPSSIDVRLSNVFRVFNNHLYEAIDPSVEQPDITREIVVDEVISLNNLLAARLDGKSSIARHGLIIHSAGFIDPNFSGQITLELSNMANLPIKLWPGMKIGQICVFRLSSSAHRLYGSTSVESKYQSQRGPTPSRSWMNFSTSMVD